MRLWALALFAAAIVACTDDDGRLDGPRVPRFVAPAAGPSVALALGSGGPRGFAHIGALLALEESGIRADLVVGSSAGALVGALHAAGLTALQLEALAMDMPAANPMSVFAVAPCGPESSAGPDRPAALTKRVTAAAARSSSRKWIMIFQLNPLPMRQHSNDPQLIRILDKSVMYILVICLVLFILSPLFR